MRNEATKLFLPCGCVSNCNVLAVDRWQWDDESDGEWQFEVYTRAHSRSNLRWRLKTAWQVLRNRDHYLDALVFDDKEIQALRAFIDAKLPEWPQNAVFVTTSTANYVPPPSSSVSTDRGVEG